MPRTEGAPDGAGSGTPPARSRAGARRGPKAKRSFQPRLALLSLGALVALAAWAFLVWAAIGFGRDARGGDSGRWAYLAAASVGAVACLFLSLLLVTWLLRAIGVLEAPARGDGPSGPHRH